MSPPAPAGERTPPGDRELLDRATRGDRAAFGQLYQRHVRPVYWQSYAVVHNATDAEDSTQEVFITAWKKLNTITIVDDSLLPWLLVTARYTALNKRRSSLREQARRSELDQDLPDRGASVEDDVVYESLLMRINKSVAELSVTDRELYELCIGGDHSYAEAARQLGVSHGAIRNRVSRIRQRLRADLHVLRGTP